MGCVIDDSNMIVMLQSMEQVKEFAGSMIYDAFNTQFCNVKAKVIVPGACHICHHTCVKMINVQIHSVRSIIN